MRPDPITQIPSMPAPGSEAWRRATGSMFEPEYIFDDLQVCELCSNPLFPIGSSGTCKSCDAWIQDLGVYQGPLSWVKDLIREP